MPHSIECGALTSQICTCGHDADTGGGQERVTARQSQPTTPSQKKEVVKWEEIRRRRKNDGCPYMGQSWNWGE